MHTCICDIALCMPEGPDYGVNDELELPRGHGEQGAKAGIGDGPQQVEELQPVLRVVLQQVSMVCALYSSHDCQPIAETGAYMDCTIHQEAAAG